MGYERKARKRYVMKLLYYVGGGVAEKKNGKRFVSKKQNKGSGKA